MKKLMTFFAASMATLSAWAAGGTYTLTLNGAVVETPAPAEGDGSYFTVNNIGGFNAKFNGATWEGTEFTKGMKLNDGAYVQFTTTEVSTIEIIQSTWSAYGVNVNGTLHDLDEADEYTGYRKFIIADAAAATYKIERGSGKESGLFAVRVTYGATPKYTISASTENGGASTVSGAGVYVKGKRVTLTAVPAAGKSFVKWTDGVNDVCTENPYSFAASAIGSYVAVFEDALTHNVSTSVNDAKLGSIDISGQTPVVEGETFTCVATPNTGAAFVNWTKDGVEVSTSNTLSVVSSTANAGEYVANFVALYAVTYAPGDGSVGAENQIKLTPFYADIDGKIATWPINRYFYKEGATLTGWSDGVSTYALGEEITIAANTTLTAVYTDNTVALSELASEATVTWNFARVSGLETHIEGSSSEGYVVTSASLDGKTVDLALRVAAGKFYNIGRDANAQVNAGTKIYIPVVKGAQIVINSADGDAYLISTSEIDGSTDYAGAGTNTISYTYEGEDGEVLFDVKDGKYYASISVTYPAASAVVTAVDAPEAEVAADGEMYNLAGQKVSKAYKGIVISNGKLKIVK